MRSSYVILLIFTPSDSQFASYFTNNGHQGVCIFRRRETSDEGLRGARLGALGLLVAKSSKPRPWRHLNALKALSDQLDDDPEERDALLNYYETHKSVEDAKVDAWDGWAAELQDVSPIGFQT